MDHLIEPHGGVLCDLQVDDERAEELKAASIDYPSVTLSDRQLCDLELLLNGGFSPLTGFLGEEDYHGVLEKCRLSDGTVWPMPITLDVAEDTAAGLEPGQPVALRDPEGFMLAVLHLEETYRPDKEREAEAVFGTSDRHHPGVAYLLDRSGPVYLAGRVEGLQLPLHYDFTELRLTPAELRTEFAKRGWRRVVAFQTRNPMHRAHQELTLRAASEQEAGLLIHPVVGMTKPGDIDHFTRVRCYQALAEHYPDKMMTLALLPLAMRMGGPREALWHALIRKNYGCTHFIVGRDHAGPGKNGDDEDFYGPYDAQELVAEYEEELGIRMVPFKEMAYVEERAEYLPVDEVPADATVKKLSGTEVRRRLKEGLEIPEWFSYPNVVAELRRSHPPKHKQGLTIFFTGLSGSGKSTVANVLLARFREIGGRPVTLLDGDIVRQHLSSELGFSREHRNLNVRRIGFVASEITKNGGIAICAPIAPYRHVREENRELIEGYGGFIEVHVKTPLEVCEARDRKGLYAKARAGQIKEFTGIDDPYEEPVDPEVAIDTSDLTPMEAAQEVLLHLEKAGYLR
ncbi:adenylyltransferase [Thiohalorhabdus denitrificans]|uniref:Adenylyl-sulfate kinase n=1 Tax=Thiohalorhabdus denitrificans TaxID=381306 RepID=A0A0P9CXS6_9GAMM|nr:bifunctional sulfate adenylyltransferase/adenylylsulfate kinase [Thiohalorhabdus denitrificans]KPV41684.1 adenylyltransferase [Thiohalorhabdus denitrificans]SCY55656.1 sulfate adenylyltransferase [Thiohalorhabdus denitrificans]